MECITDYLPDYGETPRKPFNIEPEPREVYTASWVFEKARRIEARRRELEQAYFRQFKGSEE